MTLSHAQLNPTPTDTHIYTDIFTICTRHRGWGCGQILKSHRIRSIHLLTFSHSTNQAQQLSFPKALISLHTSPVITLSITYCNYPFICPYHPCSAHLLDHLSCSSSFTYHQAQNLSKYFHRFIFYKQTASDASDCWGLEIKWREVTLVRSLHGAWK